ncbi:MAG: 16S rRNA (guanine(527)-N(7))-methyltransferase RsmG [Candidatus Cryptobacteroides sp.]
MEFIDFEKIVKKEFPFVTSDMIEMYRAMEEIYREWNAKINVISRKDIDQIYCHHVLHSLAIASYMEAKGNGILDDFLDGTEVLDLGTGGGFPGIPLAILFQNSHFTLCDSIGKKITVATEAAKALGLKNVNTVNARAESLGTTFDYIVSRAVTSLDNFLPWVKGKYRKGVLCLKGGDIAEEIGIAMGRFRMKAGTVHTWHIESSYDDSYFDGKYVVHIEKY